MCGGRGCCGRGRVENGKVAFGGYFWRNSPPRGARCNPRGVPSLHRRAATPSAAFFRVAREFGLEPLGDRARRSHFSEVRASSEPSTTTKKNYSEPTTTTKKNYSEPTTTKKELLRARSFHLDGRQRTHTRNERNRDTQGDGFLLVSCARPVRAKLVKRGSAKSEVCGGGVASAGVGL